MVALPLAVTAKEAKGFPKGVTFFCSSNVTTDQKGAIGSVFFMHPEKSVVLFSKVTSWL